jgi:hypothetical protein
VPLYEPSQSKTARHATPVCCIDSNTILNHLKSKSARKFDPPRRAADGIDRRERGTLLCPGVMRSCHALGVLVSLASARPELLAILRTYQRRQPARRPRQPANAYSSLKSSPEAWISRSHSTLLLPIRTRTPCTRRIILVCTWHSLTEPC